MQAAHNLEIEEGHVETPRVSVLTTTFNVAPYVADALRSALEQQLEDIEIIVVDDGSTDDTVAVIRRFHDARIRIFEQSHRGPVSALNAALALARGEFIAFLDGDDVWHPEKLIRHVRFFEEHPGIDLTFSWHALIDENGREIGLTSRRWFGPISFEQLLTDNVIASGSLVVARRTALIQVGRFDESFGACHDLDLWLRLALQHSQSIASVSGFLTYYRQRPGQLTKNVKLMEDSWNQLLAKTRGIAPRQTALVASIAASNMSRYFAYLLHENGDYEQAQTYLVRSFRQAPLHFISDRRSWKMLAANVAARVLPASWYQLLRGAVLRLVRNQESGYIKAVADSRKSCGNC